MRITLGGRSVGDSGNWQPRSKRARIRDWRVDMICGFIAPAGAAYRQDVPCHGSCDFTKRTIVAGQEGVIKFELWFLETSPLPEAMFREVNAWRKRLYAAQLIGRDPARYDGFGFGNISQRIAPFGTPPHARRFVITGSQTGGRPTLTAAEYALVRESHADQNLIAAEGPILPSSESLTHGTLYALDTDLRCVMHVHSPVLWHNASLLGLPATRVDVPYGSPEMSDEVKRLYGVTQLRKRRIFAMGGHTDGLVSFGVTTKEAGSVLMSALARAESLDQQ